MHPWRVCRIRLLLQISGFWRADTASIVCACPPARGGVHASGPDGPAWALRPGLAVGPPRVQLPAREAAGVIVGAEARVRGAGEAHPSGRAEPTARHTLLAQQV